MKKSNQTQTNGGLGLPPPTTPNSLTYKHLRIGAIILGASAFLPVGAIAAPIAIPTVFVENTDGASGNSADSTGYGSVNDNYYIGTYEVTTTEYAAFLNAVGKTVVDKYGLYNAAMADTEPPSQDNDWQAAGCGIALTGTTYSVISGRENKPVNFVSFWDAARFCNWLTTNGTDTETGMYNLGGVKNPTNYSVTRDSTAWSAGGVAIASENEWYKAAYYDPEKSGGAGYWKYPMKGVITPSTNDANYGNTPGGLTDVGGNPGSNYVSSYYGTFDQGGNVFEWNEAIISTGNRGVRGGAFNGGGADLAASARYDFCAPSNEYGDLGFRVASKTPIVVPEPQTYALFGGMALLGLTLLRRRNKK